MRTRNEPANPQSSSGVRAVVSLALVVLCADVSNGGRGPVTTLPSRASEPVAAAPGYLERGYVDPITGFPVTRIAADSGAVLLSSHARWGADSRHHYSKDQPWNSDEKLIWLENPKISDGIPAGAEGPRPVLLDGETYQPLRFASFANWRPTDSRWHPSPLYPNVRVGIVHSREDGLDSLMWVDVGPSPNGLASQIRGWRLPIRPTLIGQGEGNLSADGRFVALSEVTGERARIVVVDMDPPESGRLNPSGHGRLGPVYELPPCSLATGCRIGNVSISP